MTRAVNQLAAGQKATSSLGTASRSPVVVNAGRGGLGPPILPNVRVKSAPILAARDAIEAQTNLAWRYRNGIFASLTPREQQAMSYRYGGRDGAIKKVIKDFIADFDKNM